MSSFYFRKSASLTKIEIDGEKSGEELDDNNTKNTVSSSKTWTNAMGRTLRRKLSAFRKDNKDSERFCCKLWGNLDRKIIFNYP